VSCYLLLLSSLSVVVSKAARSFHQLTRLPGFLRSLSQVTEEDPTEEEEEEDLTEEDSEEDPTEVSLSCLSSEVFSRSLVADRRSPSFFCFRISLSRRRRRRTILNVDG